MANVVSIFEVLVLNFLHQNHIGVAYVRTSKFRMEPIKYVPLYSMVMPKFIITVTKPPFV
jgi:hypothetical protein